jgi:hypothetical protein
MMSWETPDQSWQFMIGDDPPGDLPAEWAAASQAVTRDLNCRRYGRPVTLRNVMWRFLAADGFVCVGFALAGDADVGAYERCKSYRLHTTTAQATVWMADDIQEELAGYEYVQWPIAGNHILSAEIVGNRASWINPTNDTTVSLIGKLCEMPDS